MLDVLTRRYIEYQRGAAANAYESVTQRRKNWSQFVGRFLGADGVLTLHMMSARAGDGSSWCTTHINTRLMRTAHTHERAVVAGDVVWALFQQYRSLMQAGARSAGCHAEAHKLSAVDGVLPTAHKRPSISATHARPSFLPLSNNSAACSHVGAKLTHGDGGAFDMKHGGSNFV